MSGLFFSIQLLQTPTRMIATRANRATETTATQILRRIMGPSCARYESQRLIDS
jgi:hypothetical protein